MRSVTLPPDLRTIAREALRDGAPTPAPARTARVLGLGHHVPAEVVPNGPIAERIGVDDAWIVKRTGIKSRRRAAPSERLSDLATFAGRRALADAAVEPLDLDLVLVATMTPDEITPNAAPVVAHALERGARAAHGRPLDLPGRRQAPVRDDGRRRRPRRVGARGRGPVRLPPGQRPDHPRRRRAARSHAGPRRRLRGAH